MTNRIKKGSFATEVNSRWLIPDIDDDQIGQWAGMEPQLIPFGGISPHGLAYIQGIVGAPTC